MYAGNVIFDSYIIFILDAIFIVTSVMSFAAAITLRCGVKAELTQTDAIAHRGGKCVVRLKITNKSLLPLTACKICFRVTDINKSGRKRKKFIKQETAVICPPRKTIEKQIEFVCSRCELLEARMTGIYVYDFFRFFCLRRKLKQNLTITVLPKYPDKYVVDRMSTVVGEDEENMYSTVKAGDDPTEIFAIREYASGDKIRNIHWKLTSKKSELMVKDYSLMLTDNDTVIIDIFNAGLGARKERALLDSMYDMLYGIVLALTSRGHGFTACYMKDGFTSVRIENDNDINGMFSQLYAIKPYDIDNSCAVNYHARSEVKDKNRIYYIATTNNAGTAKNMAMLSELGIVYCVLPDADGVCTLPHKFTMRKEAANEQGIR